MQENVYEVYEPLISIIIPVYNVEKYLPRCLDSVLSQSYRNIEVILVDDGSTDRSGSICDDYKLKDSRITVLHQENNGVSSARNLGLDAAHGEWIGFVDSDDYIASNMYEVLVNNALQFNVDISYCGMQQFQLDGNVENIYGTGEKRAVTKEEAIKGYFFDKSIQPFMYALWNKIFSAIILKKVRFDRNLAIGEDILFVFDCLQECNSLYFEDQCLYYYMRRSNSAMTSSFSDKRMDYIVAVERIAGLCNTQYLFAQEESERWQYFHYLITCRQLICNPAYKKKYINKFIEMKKFLKNKKSKYYSKLGIKRKIDFWLVCYFPFIYRIIIHN